MPIKGIPYDPPFPIEDYINIFKKIGANWVQLVLWVLVTDNGTLIEYTTSVYNENDIPPGGIREIIERSKRTEEVLTSVIKQLHENGFKIFLITYHERLAKHHLYGEGLDIDMDKFLNDAAEIAIKWARICEEYNVEMYAPRKELQMFIGDEKALEWDEMILPKIRKVYHGFLVRGAFTIYSWNPIENNVTPRNKLPSNMSGWDFLGIDLYGNRVNTFKEWASFVNRVFLKAYEIKKRFRLRGIVFEELGLPHSGEEKFWINSSVSGREIINKLYEIVFECGAGMIDGFFPWLWENGSMLLPNNKIEYIAPSEVIRRYYLASFVLKLYDDILPARESKPPNIIIYNKSLLFKEDFENGTASVFSGSNYQIVNGTLKIEKGCVDTYDLPNNTIFTFKIKFINGSLGLGFRNSDGWYEFRIKPISHLELIKHKSYFAKHIMETEICVELNKWYNFTLITLESAFQLYIDGVIVVGYIDPDPLFNGHISFHAEEGCIVLDNVTAEEILNGMYSTINETHFWLNNMRIINFVADGSELIGIILNITNIGDMIATYVFNVTANNSIIYRKHITLSPGESKSIIIWVSIKKPGLYMINIEWLYKLFIMEKVNLEWLLSNRYIPR
ncbi:MAG TPA: hypothetical protein ENG40_00825 [Thermoprotei archaeon]|nr:hypothetical protein [Thermoprotei archaeon]